MDRRSARPRLRRRLRSTRQRRERYEHDRCARREPAAALTGARDGAAADRAAHVASSAATSRGQRGAPRPESQGRIPVLEYHVIGGDKNALYTRTARATGRTSRTCTGAATGRSRSRRCSTRTSATCRRDVARGLRVRRRVAVAVQLPRAEREARDRPDERRWASGWTSRSRIPGGRTARRSAC